MLRRLDRGPLVAGQAHTIVSWPVALDGRKRYAGAALYAPAVRCSPFRALGIELKV